MSLREHHCLKCQRRWPCYGCDHAEEAIQTCESCLFSLNFRSELEAIAARRTDPSVQCTSPAWLERAKRLLHAIGTPDIALDDVARWLHEVYVFGVDGDTPLPIVVREYLKALDARVKLGEEGYRTFRETGKTPPEWNDALDEARGAEKFALNSLRTAWSAEGVVIENEIDRLRAACENLRAEYRSEEVQRLRNLLTKGSLRPNPTISALAYCAAEEIDRLRNENRALRAACERLDDCKWCGNKRVLDDRSDCPYCEQAHAAMRGGVAAKSLKTECCHCNTLQLRSSMKSANRTVAGEPRLICMDNESCEARRVVRASVENENDVDRLRAIVTGLLEALPKCDECKAPATWRGNTNRWVGEEPEPYWCDEHLPADREEYVSITDLDPNDTDHWFKLYKFELKHAATIRKLGGK